MAHKTGSEIDAWCTKCRMDLSHRVVAVVAGVAKRVECQTCHTQHNYRAPKGAKSPVPRAEKPPSEKKTAAKRTTKAETARLDEYDARVSGKLESEFTNYSIKQVFKVGQLIRHKNFGEGYVSELLDNKKLNVVFRAGPKILIHSQ